MIEILPTLGRWPKAPLGELCDIRGGFPAPQNDSAFDEGEVPFVRMKDVGRWHLTNNLCETEQSLNRAHFEAGRYQLTPRGSILMPRSGSVALNHRAILTIDAVVVSHLCALVPTSDQVTVDFLYRFLCLADMRKLTKKTTGLDSIAFSDLRLVAIPLPPLAEQRRIAEVLDRAEALRAKRRVALSQLETLNQSIFFNLFGDPVANPKRWTDPKLGGMLVFQQYGPRFYNESYSADGIRIVRITDLNEAGMLDFSAMPRMAVSNADRTKYALRPGDLIFARTGATVGKVALIQPNDPPCIAGAYFITMRFKETLDPIYARAVLTAPSVRAIVTKRSRQAAQQNFSGPGLRELPMPLPPLALQREFARRVGAVEKLKTTQRASLAELDALFATLQHRAFKGELFREKGPKRLVA